MYLLGGRPVPPSPSRFRPSAWRTAACALAAALALTLAAGAAQAQTSVNLVSTTGQGQEEDSRLSQDFAQAFTTGSNPAGYRLTRVDLKLKEDFGTAPTFTVSINSDSSNSPGNSLGTLTQQGSLPSTAGLVQFNAADTGIALAKDTTYWLVLDVTANESFSHRTYHTASNAEDAGAAAGWSVADSSLWRAHNVSSWQPPQATTLLLAIYGYAENWVPTVSNPILDQAAISGTAFSYQFPADTFVELDPGDTLTYTATKSDDNALPSWLTFNADTRTFSGTPQAANVGTVSVKLTASDGTASVSETFNIVVLAAGTGATPIGVEIVSTPTNDADNNGTPETYTLGKIVDVRVTFSKAVTVTGTPRLKVKLGSATTTEFWATYLSGSGTRTLIFGYTVVALHTSTVGIAVLEDTLELNGGTIQDADGTNAGLTHKGLGHDANHKVNYTITSGPALVSAAVNGTKLTMTFDTALSTALTPAGSVFEVTATLPGGSSRTIAGTGTTGISTRYATVTLERAVVKGETVTVSYTKPTTNPLTNALVTSRADSFTGQKVTNGSPVRQRPLFASGFEPLRLKPGEAMTPVTLPEATGGNGAPYTYSLTSEPTGLAGLSFDAATRVLSGTPAVEEGLWTFAYTAHDGDTDTDDADAARLVFRVTVASVAFEQQQQVVKHTLAAVASRAVAGALDNIGTRLGAAVPAPGLTLAGETVPFGVSGTVSGGTACSPDARERHGFATGASGCARARSRGVAADTVLPTSAFSLTLGAAEGDPGFDPSAPRWALWGRGDFGSFSGRPDAITHYRGETRTGWLGLDAREPERSGGRPGRWVAGLAISRGSSKTDYDLEGEKGRIETDLTAVWPYGRWSFGNGLELRGMLGAGRGEVRHAADDGTQEKSRLRMWTGAAGLRRPLSPVAGVALAAQGDASFARMQTAPGDEAVDGLRVDVWRLRVGAEASRRFALEDGALLTPFLAASARQDGGDGVTGTGLELAGGLRYGSPGVAVEARVRWLVAHTRDDTEERGASVTVRVGPAARGRGLSLALSPRWGAPADGAGALWREELPKGGTSGAAREAGALDLRVGYGFGLFGDRFTGTPNAGLGLSDGGARDYRIGWHLTPAVRGAPDFQVDLGVTRREPAGGPAPPEHAVTLHNTILW